MPDITLEALATASPVTETLSGGEPIETEIATVGKGSRLRQLSVTPPVIQTSATYTLVAEDQGRVVEMDRTSVQTVTVPLNVLPIGATLLIRRIGTGSVTIAAAASVTIVKKASVSLSISEQWGQVVLHQRALNEWHLTGELLAA